MLDLDADGRFRSGPYIGLTPADAAILISIDVSATATGLLSGPALPVSDIVDVSETGFQPQNFSGLAFDPLAASLVLEPLRSGNPVTAAAVLPFAAEITERIVASRGGLMTTTIEENPLAALERTLQSLCGADQACRDEEIRGINAFAANVDKICGPDLACKMQRIMEGQAISGEARRRCGLANFPCIGAENLSLATAVERARIAQLESAGGMLNMSSPFDLSLVPFTGASGNTAGVPAGGTMPESFFGGLLGGLVNQLPAVLSGLARAGVIRGSVGQALAPMQAAALPAMMGGFNVFSGPPMFAPLPAPPSGVGGALGMANNALSILESINNMIGFGGGGGASCGSNVQPVVMAPSLFRTNACGKSTLPSRVQVMGPNGAIYVVANLGRATRGASEARVMRRLARDNGFTVGRRGSARSGRRRRPR